MTLAAHGEPTPLALGTIEPREWLEYHSLTGGNQLSCQENGHCGPTLFGEHEETFAGVDVRIVPPVINGQVYWEARVQSVDSTAYVGGAVLRQGDETGGQLRFAKLQPEYCVISTIVDLRDDHELTSQPICWSPVAPRKVDETNVIAGCAEPPSPALRWTWCRYHQERRDCQSLGDDVVEPGTAGSGGSAGAPGAILGNAGGAGLPRTGAILDDDAVRDDSSSACSVGQSRRASGLGAVAVLALAALGLRRKRVTRG